MVTLSIADRYHLHFAAELPSSVNRAQWQAQLYLPSLLTMGNTASDQQFFYRNLLQRQSLQPQSQSWLSLQAQLRSALAQQNQQQFHQALAGIVHHLLQQFDRADGNQLLLLRSTLLQLQRQWPQDKAWAKRFRMAVHVVLFSYQQALLGILQAGSQREQPTTLTALRRFNRRINQFAQHHGLPLQADDEASREKLLLKVQLSRRIVNRPFSLQRTIYRDGHMAQQLIFGIAAAMAMAFATAVAFATQRAFGNFTTPFFFSLVLSYIFKDRLKELGRDYLLATYLRHFSQHKYRLIHSASKQHWLTISEHFFHYSGRRLGRKIDKLKHAIRSADRAKISSVWCYRRQYQLTKESKNNTEKFCDNLTLNVSRQLRFLPSEQDTIWHQDGAQARRVKVHRVRTMFVQIQYKTEQKTVKNLFRVHVSRKGIHRITPVQGPS